MRRNYVQKYLVLILTVLAINLFLNVPAFADAKENKETKTARKLKREITKLGSGSEAKIEVKLKDGTKLKGYVGEVADDYFTVVNENTKTATSVPYANAKQVKGNNLSNGAIVVIIVGVVVVIGLLGGIFFAQ